MAWERDCCDIKISDILNGTVHVEIVQDIHISKPVLIHIETHSVQTYFLLRRTALFKFACNYALGA